MLVRWLLTVFSAMPSSPLIAAVGSPAATSDRTWTSRSVSGSPLRARRELLAGERLIWACRFDRRADASAGAGRIVRAGPRPDHGVRPSVNASMPEEGIPALHLAR